MEIVLKGYAVRLAFGRTGGVIFSPLVDPPRGRWRARVGQRLWGYS